MCRRKRSLAAVSRDPFTFAENEDVMATVFTFPHSWTALCFVLNGFVTDCYAVTFVTDCYAAVTFVVFSCFVNPSKTSSSSSALQLFMSFGLLNYFFPLFPLLRPPFPFLHSHLSQVIK
jgi:hypothetical protein